MIPLFRTREGNGVRFAALPVVTRQALAGLRQARWMAGRVNLNRLAHSNRNKTRCKTSWQRVTPPWSRGGAARAPV